METFIIIAILSLIMGMLNGSYFSLAACNDNKLILNPYFFILIAIAMCSTMMVFGAYLYSYVTGNSIGEMLFYLICFSVFFIFYSASYLFMHVILSRKRDPHPMAVISKKACFWNFE